MTSDSDTSERVKCPFCSELIKPDAKICRFCHSELTPAPAAAVQKPLSLWKAILLNFTLPGLAAWRYGFKWRGLITGLVILTALCIWGLDVTELIQTEIPKIVKISNPQKIEASIRALLENCKDNFWFDIFIWGYVLSFIDLIFLAKLSKKRSEAGVTE